MNLAIRENMVPGDSLPERLEWIDRAGLQGIELCGPALGLPAADVLAAFRNSPVRLASIDGGVGLLDPDPAVRQTARDRISARLELAGELGAAGVLLVPQFGRTPALPDLSPVAAAAILERDLLLAALRDLAPLAARAKTTLFLEPLNRYEAYLVNRIEQGAAFATEVGPPVGVMADFFHMNIEEVDLAASIRDNAAHVVHVHVADSNRLQPGRGHLDFGPGFAALKHANYDAWFGIECRIDGPIDRAVPKSAAYLQSIWEQA